MISQHSAQYNTLSQSFNRIHILYAGSSTLDHSLAMIMQDTSTPEYSVYMDDHSTPFWIILNIPFPFSFSLYYFHLLFHLSSFYSIYPLYSTVLCKIDNFPIGSIHTPLFPFRPSASASIFRLLSRISRFGFCIASFFTLSHTYTHIPPPPWLSPVSASSSTSTTTTNSPQMSTTSPPPLLRPLPPPSSAKSMNELPPPPYPPPPNRPLARAFLNIRSVSRGLPSSSGEQINNRSNNNSHQRQ